MSLHTLCSSNGAFVARKTQFETFSEGSLNIAHQRCRLGSRYCGGNDVLCQYAQVNQQTVS